MKILLVEPGKAPVEKEIAGTLASMQKTVGGTIQAIYPFDEPVVLICNDDGKLLNLPMCRFIHETGDIIFGSFFVCAAPANSQSFASLSDEQMKRYSARFRAAELFVPQNDAIFVLKL